MESGRFAAAFYRSKRWQRCRAGYVASVGGLCERCLKRGLIVPGDEVHHRTRLTPDNLTDPAIAYAWENLELLCRDCHKAEHKPEIRWRCDETGHVEI